jgi:glyceraldehyde-3-phosphate dehydrogenase (ferredoxin)
VPVPPALEAIARTASRINARNASVYWDSARNVEILSSFLARQRDVEGAGRPELRDWLQRFAEDPREAALGYWYEIHRGIHEALRAP